MTATDTSAARQYDMVLYETRGVICSIALIRPEKLNDAFFEFAADPQSWLIGVGMTVG